MVFIVKHFRVFGTSLLLILASALFQVVYYAAAKIIFPGNDELISIESPLVFLHGPLSYFLYLTAAGIKRSIREKAKHLLPFTVILGGYVILLFKSAFHAGTFSKGLLWYNQWSALSIASLLIYLITISLSNRNRPMLYPSIQRFLGQLNILYLFIGLIQLIGIVQRYKPAFHMGINTQEVQYALLLVVASFAVREIIAIKELPAKGVSSGSLGNCIEKSVQLPEILESPDAAGSYHKSTLDDRTLHQYAIKVQCFLEESKLYLDPDLSLEKLAAETGIPKHHLSQLLSSFFGNSFYQFIAGHRIVYAMQLLRNSQENLTLVSFAKECGFNSKTSFNRYFKEYVGCTPSEYRSKTIAARDIKKKVTVNV